MFVGKIRQGESHDTPLILLLRRPFYVKALVYSIIECFIICQSENGIDVIDNLLFGANMVSLAQ